MALMTKTRLTLAVHNCPSVLEKLAQKLSSTSFSFAVKHYDADTVNDILEDAVRRCLGTDSISYGLEQYCRKFDIMDDLSKLDNIDRILLIDAHKNEIERKLKDAGV